MEMIYAMMIIALFMINIAICVKLHFLEEKMTTLESSFQSVLQDFQEILNEIIYNVYEADQKMDGIISKCEEISKKLDSSFDDLKEFPAPIVPIKPNNWKSMNEAFRVIKRTVVDE